MKLEDFIKNDNSENENQKPQTPVTGYKPIEHVTEQPQPKTQSVEQFSTENILSASVDDIFAEAEASASSRLASTPDQDLLKKQEEEAKHIAEEKQQREAYLREQARLKAEQERELARRKAEEEREAARRKAEEERQRDIAYKRMMQEKFEEANKATNVQKRPQPVSQPVQRPQQPVVQPRQVQQVKPVQKPTLQPTPVPQQKPVAQPTASATKAKPSGTAIDMEQALKLFKKSETEEQYKEKWLLAYEKAWAVPEKKMNYVFEKCRQGRFTIRDGKIELLSNFDTAGKSVKDLLNTDWKLN